MQPALSPSWLELHRLALPPHYAGAPLLQFLERRQIPGVEKVTPDSYQRTVEFEGIAGQIRVHWYPPELVVSAEPRVAPFQGQIVEKVRRMFDVDVDAKPILRRLRRAEPLKQRLRGIKDIRVPGAWSRWEVVVRAVLGQQVSVAAARTLAGRFVQTFGDVIDAEGRRVFPGPERVVAEDVSVIGMPRVRARSISLLAEAYLSGLLEDRGDLASTIQAWTELPGIGLWTAHYIAMRTCQDRDAFPASDLVLRQSAGAPGEPLSEKAQLALGEAWRPYRSYAAIALWQTMPAREIDEFAKVRKKRILSAQK